MYAVSNGYFKVTKLAFYHAYSHEAGRVKTVIFHRLARKNNK